MSVAYNMTIRNVNTFLTNMTLGYKLDDPIADFIAPPFKVKLEAGKYAEYTASVFRVWDDKIIGSEEPKEVQWDVDENAYACEDYSMGKFVSDKDKAQSIDPIRMDTDAAYMLKRFHHKAREYRVNQIAASTTLVTQNINIGGDWNVKATGTPVADILVGIDTIAGATGGYKSNRIAIPLKVALNLITTDEWRDYFKYTQVGFASQFDCVSGLRNLGLEPMVFGSYGLSEDKGTASDPQLESLWGENVLLFYCEPNPSTQCRSFMYSPFVARDIITTTRVQRRRGEYHDIYSNIDELLVDAGCAYLLTNTLT